VISFGPVSPRLKSALRGALVTVAAGVGCLVLAPVRAGLEWLSYDLPFLLRADLDVTNVALVCMDQASHDKLGQPFDAPWDRAVHARLIERLAAEGARAVVFDIAFDRPGTNDGVLLQAITNARKAGMAVVVAAFTDPVPGPGGSSGRRIVPPFKALAEVAAWGVVEEGPSGKVIRRHSPGVLGQPTLAWRVAELTSPETLPEPSEPRWINYYGPARTVPYYSYHDVFTGNFRPGWFSNWVLFVGGGYVSNIGFTGGRRVDEWPTPHTWLTGHKCCGVEINATVYLNLVRADWLRRLPAWADWVAVLVTGLVGGGLTLGRRRLAVSLGALGTTALVALATWLVARRLAWFAWMIPVAVQVPVALGWALVRRRPQRQMVPQEGTRKIVVPHYSLVRCIGTGAYGDVWLARDIFGNFRAVKVVFRERFPSDEPYQREFRGIEKYMPISRSHPGWVDVLHVGCDEQASYFFYIMELADDEVNGRNIHPETYAPKNLAKELKKRGRLPLAEVVSLGLALSAALDHLHRHRLIHRDIKPSNVIFVNGVPKFADIGLVTDMQSSGREVSCLGTFGYIPPEGPGAPSADIYGLGKVLYQTFTGRSLEEFPEMGPPPTEPEELRAWTELKDIILKACAEQPQDRYPRAAEVCADLLRVQDRLGPNQG